MRLALILICHCSYRGVVELLRDLCDYTINTGTVGDQVEEFEQGEALVRHLTRKAQATTTSRMELESLIEKAKMKGEGHKFSFKLGRVPQAEEKAIKLAIEVKTLFYWLRLDILSLLGPAYRERRELMDFIISELKIR